MKNSIALENLQELDIIFSDKTGTLTKNHMVFYGCGGADNRIHKVIDQIKSPDCAYQYTG